MLRQQRDWVVGVRKKPKSVLTYYRDGPYPIILFSEGCRNFCPLIFKAVCGSDGNTYGNECQLKSKACRESRSDLVAGI